VPPAYAGCWQLTDSYRISVTKKPNAFHRFMTTLLLGWEWVEWGRPAIEPVPQQEADHD